MIIKQ